MQKLDVRGLSCPLPVIKTKQVMDQGSHDILILGTSQVSRDNVSKLAINQGYTVEMKVDAKDKWEMELHK